MAADSTSSGIPGNDATYEGQQISGQQIFATTGEGSGSQDEFATTARGEVDATTTSDTVSDSANQLAGQVGETLRGNTSAATSAAKDLYNQAKEPVKQAASAAFGQVQQRASSTLTQGKETVVENLHGVAENIRQIGGNLGQTQTPGDIGRYAAQYSDTIARQVEGLSTYLDDRDINELVRDVERFARRNPSLFIGAAFVLGIVGGRFLKSSSPNQALMVRPRTADLDYERSAGYAGGSGGNYARSTAGLDRDAATYEYGSSTTGSGLSGTGTTGSSYGSTTGTTGNTFDSTTSYTESTMGDTTSSTDLGGIDTSTGATASTVRQEDDVTSTRDFGTGTSGLGASLTDELTPSTGGTISSTGVTSTSTKSSLGTGGTTSNTTTTTSNTTSQPTGTE